MNRCGDTARSRKDETQNGRWNGSRNARWSSQVSFQRDHLKRALKFHHPEFRFPFWLVFLGMTKLGTGTQNAEIHCHQKRKCRRGQGKETHIGVKIRFPCWGKSPITPMKTCLKSCEHPWKLVWKLRGHQVVWTFGSRNFFSLISSACKQYEKQTAKEASQRWRARHQDLQDLRVVQPAWSWYYATSLLTFPVGLACHGSWGLANQPVRNVWTGGILFVGIISKSFPPSALSDSTVVFWRAKIRIVDRAVEAWDLPRPIGPILITCCTEIP
jgi:hypothetical protein